MGRFSQSPEERRIGARIREVGLLALFLIMLGLELLHECGSMHHSLRPATRWYRVDDPLDTAAYSFTPTTRCSYMPDGIYQIYFDEERTRPYEQVKLIDGHAVGVITKWIEAGAIDEQRIMDEGQIVEQRLAPPWWPLEHQGDKSTVESNQ